MLTTAPHLYIRRPSPTTAEFTVTTCPPLTIPLRLLLLIIHLARLVLVSASVLALYSRFLFDPSAAVTTATAGTVGQQQQYNATSNNNNNVNDGQGGEAFALLLAGDVTAFAAALLTAARLSRAGALLDELAAPLPDWALAAACAGTVYAVACRFRLHTTESVLVLRGLGIQTCSSGSAAAAAGAGGGSRWGWARQTRFIPTEKIRDVLINEGFRGFEVRYYLCVVVEGEEDVVVLFPGTLPRRKIVEAVWRGIRACLVEGDGGDGGEKG
ncbi:phosphatidylinositol N-acetylglucosaminyltransferase subunit gpi15 [Corynascus novoguineensis]|uniref:Phosphatidylinositol N-acetylglucosaminyltransferase subunit gpi15 n=1 Tax=Corynascus novoguineensis TaxID=1126955 RepID=A0AAN7HIQ6_9PEZI|nr:phosphatidylinositol N-acetylglucosaminyltransferase subunit gpi15 [Corynascus novoguineensis]